MLGSGAIDQKDGARLGIQGIDLPYPVVFLHGPGKFVLLDAIRVIGRHRGGGDQARLDVLAHGQAIDVVTGRRVPLQDALRQHALQVLPRLGIDLRGIGVRIRRQIHLGPGDMEEAPGPPRHHGAGLVGTHHIIGGRGHLRRAARGRAQSGEGLDQGHDGQVSRLE